MAVSVILGNVVPFRVVKSFWTHSLMVIFIDKDEALRVWLLSRRIGRSVLLHVVGGRQVRERKENACRYREQLFFHRPLRHDCSGENRTGIEGGRVVLIIVLVAILVQGLCLLHILSFVPLLSSQFLVRLEKGEDGGNPSNKFHCSQVLLVARPQNKAGVITLFLSLPRQANNGCTKVGLRSR